LTETAPQADDHFVRIEVGSEDELQELEERTGAHRQAVRHEDAAIESS